MISIKDYMKARRSKLDNDESIKNSLDRSYYLGQKLEIDMLELYINSNIHHANNGKPTE